MKAATTSYPLTMPVYAALNPRQTDTEARAVYADLIRFAVKDGQEPGTDLGNLPPGYAPLPQSWVDQALAAADLIERGSPLRRRRRWIHRRHEHQSPAAERRRHRPPRSPTQTADDRAGRDG